MFESTPFSLTVLPYKSTRYRSIITTLVVHQASGPLKAPCVRALALPRHTNASKHSSLRDVKYIQHLRVINTHPVFHLDVLDFDTTWSPPGRLAQCQRRKGHVPGVVAEHVEMDGQASDQEQLLMEQEKGNL